MKSGRLDGISGSAGDNRALVRLRCSTLPLDVISSLQKFFRRQIHRLSIPAMSRALDCDHANFDFGTLGKINGLGGHQRALDIAGADRATTKR